MIINSPKAFGEFLASLFQFWYSTPSIQEVAVANQKSRKSKFPLFKSQYNCPKNVKKNSIKLKFYTIRPCYAIFFGQDQKTCNGKPRKTRDHCNNFFLFQTQGYSHHSILFLFPFASFFIVSLKRIKRKQGSAWLSLAQLGPAFLIKRCDHKRSQLGSAWLW